MKNSLSNSDSFPLRKSSNVSLAHRTVSSPISFSFLFLGFTLALLHFKHFLFSREFSSKEQKEHIQLSTTSVKEELDEELEMLMLNLRANLCKSKSFSTSNPMIAAKPSTFYLHDNWGRIITCTCYALVLDLP
jgi:hypothetical protein